MRNTIIVFAAGFMVDIAYVTWVQAIATNNPVLAALSSIAIGGCGLLGFTGVVKNRWLAIPYLAGLGVGTYVGMAL